MRPVNTRPKGKETKDALKFGVPSSGCETHPAKAEPSRLVVSLAAVRVTKPTMRRHTSNGPRVGKPRKTQSACPSGTERRRQQRPRPKRARTGVHAAWSMNAARSKRRDEQTGRPCTLLDKDRDYGEPGNKPQRTRGSERLREPVKNKRAQPGKPPARGTKAVAQGEQGVGGPNKSEDDGERKATDPEEQRRPVLRRT